MRMILVASVLLPLLAHIAPFASPLESRVTRQEPNATVLDGVFTEAQTRRGQQTYEGNCASCHGPELQGGEDSGGEVAPTLAGSNFIVFWTELPVGSLFDRIKVSMPQDAPGRLSDAEYTDVVAFMLEANSYPAGEVELPADKAALDEIMIAIPE